MTGNKGLQKRVKKNVPRWLGVFDIKNKFLADSSIKGFFVEFSGTGREETLGFETKRRGRDTTQPWATPKDSVTPEDHLF